jgi:hypothetical protein
MKLIVAGSRKLRNRDAVYRELDQRRQGITEIVCGMALVWKWKDDPEIGGPDRYGHDWACLNGIDVKPFPAVWDYGSRAGFMRNEDMAGYADALLAFLPKEPTSGTQDMIDRMKKRKKPVIIVYETSSLDELFI